MTLLRSAFAALALIGAAFGIASTAAGQVVVHAKGEHDDTRFSQTWYETEGDWQGVWTPTNAHDPDGTFTANWHKPREVAHASLEIRLSGQAAIVTRTQPDGQHCTYRGTFNAARTVVTGTYTCDWARTPMQWRASVGSRTAAAASDQPSFGAIPFYLALRWRETEGVWRGMWTPVDPENPDGRFTAHWAHDRESARADLMITVEDGSGHVAVHRTDPGGRTCDYSGQLAGDFLNISGTYHCSDNPRNRLPWSAQILRN